MNAPDLQAIDLTPINRFEEFEPLYQRGDKLFDLGELDKFINTDRGDEEVVKFLNWVFPYAAHVKASDIHLANTERGCAVRLRGQGTELQQEFLLSRDAGMEIDRKIRARCRLNINDREKPLDGSFFFQAEVGGQAPRLIDVRVSIMPTKMGQSIVLRILDSSNAGKQLNDILMTDSMREVLLRLLESPEGMLLVCGPTGSGKTTTLYACLNHLNLPSRHIVTAEDPVEYRLPGANQVEVNFHRPFPRVLRSFLRQDPDIILVGEIRDDETASVAVNAANTGHLLLSTLHANSAAVAITRLVGLGVERYTMAEALRGFFSQRLARRLCTCALPYTPTEEELRRVVEHEFPIEHMGTSRFHVVNHDGCELCQGGSTGRGYAGRVPVFEFAENTPDVARAIITNDPELMASALSAQPQYETLTQAALGLSANGRLDFHEALYLVQRY